MNQEELLDRYKKLLQSFDPWYTHSDDHSVFKDGERKWKEICDLQPKVDQDRKIYNQLMKV